MQLKSLFLLVLLSCCPLVFGAQEENDHSEESVTTEDASNGCTGSKDMVSAVVNASNNYMLDSIIVNCLAFSDNSSTISVGVVSHRQGDMFARSIVRCVNKVLVVSISGLGYDENVTSCYQCEDVADLSSCPGDADCSPRCQFCYGPSEQECLVCEVGKYNGSCVDTCPPGTAPNPENGNECRCPGNYGGINCMECTLTKCCTGYFLDKENCRCNKTCTKYELVDITARVPKSVVGHPLEEECEHHEEGGGEEEEFDLDDEDLTCRKTCQVRTGARWFSTEGTHRVCYACGRNFCIDCRASRCIECREGTELNAEGYCEGFYEEICVRALELEEEVEHEEDLLKSYQLHLKIVLPIVCAAVIFAFISFGIIAHFRYPHVGHAKRHRRPNKKTETTTEFERTLRPQATVIFR